MIVWTPSAQRTQCLASLRDQPLSHDHLFHSVAGALGIQASEYRAALDVFAACRAP
jgi:lipid A ethanolaminephosphotransferase